MFLFQHSFVNESADGANLRAFSPLLNRPLTKRPQVASPAGIFYRPEILRRGPNRVEAEAVPDPLWKRKGAARFWEWTVP